MKKLIYSLVLAFGMLGLSGCDDSDDSGGGGGSVVLVSALGDSITAGFGFVPYPAILQDIIGKPVGNFGRNSRTTGQGLGVIGSALAGSPSHLIILLGTNDALNGSSIDQAIANLQSLVNTARNAGAVVLVGTLPPIPASGAQNNNAKAISAGIRGLSGARIVNLSNLDPALFPDGIHPNNDGQRIIAQRFAEAL